MAPSPEEHLHGLSPEEFRRCVNNLDSTGFAGLDADTAQHVHEIYIVKYILKPEKNSENADKTKRSVTAAYCNQHIDSNKGISNIVGKHMYELTNGDTQSSQSVAFMLGGGQIFRNSKGQPRKCSLTAVGVHDLEFTAAGRKSFNCINIMNHYKNRSVNLESTNMFNFVVHHWCSDGSQTNP